MARKNYARRLTSYQRRGHATRGIINFGKAMGYGYLGRTIASGLGNVSNPYGKAAMGALATGTSIRALTHEVGAYKHAYHAISGRAPRPGRIRGAFRSAGRSVIRGARGAFAKGHAFFGNQYIKLGGTRAGLRRASRSMGRGRR